ncbi:hypothetical protein BH11PSE7_BH11PSE7_08180 [soil metagenome]
MASNQRTPPRFVPTLTTVLDMPAEPHPLPPPLPLMSEEEAQHTPSAEERQSAIATAMVGIAADMAHTADETYVAEPEPELKPESEPAAPIASSDAAASAPPENRIAIDVHALSDADAFGLEEQLMHRVLQRIDLSLEERLSDAVSAAVQQQLDAMVPHLRSEIEGVLRSLVVEALSKELSDNTGSVPASGPQSVG